MPVPFILFGVAIASGIAGAVKGGEAISKNSQSKEILENAKEKFNKNKRKMEVQRKNTSRELEEYGKLKIKIWDEQFSRFLDIYKNFKNVRIEGQAELDTELSSSLSPETLKEMETLAMTAAELAAGGLGALGTGALAGVASYGGAMMFASASTGTAIASLSGVAATNATLAWFGGGSLAAGGLGMAGGAAILGGLGAGPIIAVGGFFMAAKANENLEHARSKAKEADAAVEKMKSANSLLKQIESLTKQYYTLVSKLNNKLTDLLDQLELLVFDLKCNTNIIDYDNLDHREKEFLQQNIIAIQLIKAILEKPLMTEEGKIKNSSVTYINTIPNNSQVLELL